MSKQTDSEFFWKMRFYSRHVYTDQDLLDKREAVSDEINDSVRKKMIKSRKAPFSNEALFSNTF